MDSMSGMSMGESAPHSCSTHMLGNWQTIGACFLTSSWFVKSQVQMVFTCFGVFFLVVLIELIRRWIREWDRYIVAQAIATQAKSTSSFCPSELSKVKAAFFGTGNATLETGVLAKGISQTFRPTLFQQLIRSLLYTAQFAGAYIVMLIAMSFDGYIIISIVAGGFVGHFFSTRDTLGINQQAGLQGALDDEGKIVSSTEITVAPEATHNTSSGACCN